MKYKRFFSVEETSLVFFFAGEYQFIFFESRNLLSDPGWTTSHFLIQLEKRCKLNTQKTLKKRPERLLAVLCMFKSSPMVLGYNN